jgi:hypothetical protein
MLLSLLFLNPLAGFAIGGLAGAGAGALSGTAIAFGINDDFIHEACRHPQARYFSTVRTRKEGSAREGAIRAFPLQGSRAENVGLAGDGGPD